jgi:hypothetical protein
MMVYPYISPLEIGEDCDSVPAAPPSALETAEHGDADAALETAVHGDADAVDSLNRIAFLGILFIC